MKTPSFPISFAGRAPRANGLSAVALATLALCAGNAVDAQTREQAQAVKQGTNTPALQALAAEFQRKFEADEAAVARYLAANPSVQREVVKDGVPHRIVRIGADGQPIYSKSKAGRESARSNVESGQLIKTDALYPGGSLGVDITGQSMVVGVWEPGVPRATHELLTGKVTIEANQSGDASVAAQNHATHVTGTIVGKSGLTGNGASARGLAYSAASRNWDSTNDTTEMANAAAASMLVSNHSYGYANDNTIPEWQFGAYDNESRSWDLITAAAPFYLPFVAGGNEQGNAGTQQGASGNLAKGGYDLMTGASAAKNVMTVGAVNADKSMSTYSNWGPTDDGRLKPEIVARGTGINSAQAFDAQNQASTTAYSGSAADSSGTSYASPAAAASALLLQQYHASVNSGRYMKAATLKTLVMGTAEDLGQPGPDFKFGYGLMNTEAAALAIKNNSVVTGNAPADDAACAHGTATKDINCQVAPANSKGALVYEWNANPAANSSAEMSFNVTAKGGTPLVVNLGWSDDGGTEQVAGDGTDNTTSRMVYDFDVAVRGSVDTSFKRPWVLPGMANRTADAIRATAFTFQGNGGPFRQVIVAAPATNELITIFVKKKTGSPATTRTLSMVVTGLAEAPAPVNGACGSAIGSTAAATAPIANLCTTGTATVVTANAGNYAWACNGSNGGTSTAANACTVTRGYTVTGSAGTANGTVSPPSQVVAHNTTTTLTTSPSNGYVASAIGCSGSLNGNTYSTGAVTADCTVVASFALPVVNNAAPVASNVAVTGTAQTGQTLTGSYTYTDAEGNPQGNSTFRWLRGANAIAGATATTYAVTANDVGSPLQFCVTPVASAGTAIGAEVCASATAAVTVAPANGMCGTAAGVAIATAPAANLCSAGSAGAVAPGTSSWGWSCTGTNGGNSATCAAPFAAVNGGGAVGAIQAANSNNWQINTAVSGFVALPAPAPAGVTLPAGATKVVLTTGTPGTSTTVTLRFSSIPEGAQLYKYGKENGINDTAKWFAYPATIDRAAGTVTYTLTDGQKGDNDWTVNGVIDDPVGLGVGAGGAGAGISGVPTLSQWALALLAGFMLLVGVRQVRRRH